MIQINKYFYDLHIHSALSPCGDSEMTPNNIVTMAVANGLSIIALTDHNSCKNCESMIKVANQNNLIAIPGMELCTREEVHCVCLFPSLECAMAFNELVYSLLPNIKNREDIFGKQQILDEQDNEIATEPKLLISACDIGINELASIVSRYNGICYPAHIDKASNSIISNLGLFPEDCGFNAFEVAHKENLQSLKTQNPILKTMNPIFDSDAHYFWDIKDSCGAISDNYLLLKQLSISEIFKAIISSPAN